MLDCQVIFATLHACCGGAVVFGSIAFVDRIEVVAPTLGLSFLFFCDGTGLSDGELLWRNSDGLLLGIVMVLDCHRANLVVL